MFGFQDSSGRRPLRQRTAQGARPAVRSDDLRLEGLHLDEHRLDAARPSSWTTPPGRPPAREWTPITGAGEGQPEPRGSNDLVAGNRAIVADLIHAVETDTQPRTHARAGRTAIEMVLACYASHGRGGLVTLPLAERAAHPLTVG